MKKPSFCTKCSVELTKRLSKTLDPYTGKNMLEKVCLNLACTTGCGNNGHKWKTFIQFGFSECERCEELLVLGKE